MSKENQEVKGFLSLDVVLGRNTLELAELPTGEFYVSRLGGLVPWTAIDQNEYKNAKKGCLTLKAAGKGRQDVEFDDDKMKVRLIVAAVDKDKRSDFSFASKQLLDKLTEASVAKGGDKINTAEQAVAFLVSPGEIHDWAMDIQDAAGFADKDDELADDIKN